MCEFIGFGILALLAIGGFYLMILDADMKAKMSSEGRQELKAAEEWGFTNLAMVCPHCQARGRVRTKTVKRKKGVSGAKATGAVLTGGISLIATGLSRKEELTQAHCDSCNNTWDF
jgi:hypothetical protein